MHVRGGAACLRLDKEVSSAHIACMRLGVVLRGLLPLLEERNLRGQASWGPGQHSELRVQGQIARWTAAFHEAWVACKSNCMHNAAAEAAADMRRSL